MTAPRTLALRLDDVGAASKRHEIYGRTRIPVGRWRLPFPGNFLFLKYLPPIKRWGPYRELTAAEWERLLELLEAGGHRMTVGLTAGWVEADGRVVPFPQKFPAAARIIREGLGRALLEIANHGYTHCVLDGGAFRPRLFRGNREFHREFHEWLPERVHREHLTRAQTILEDFFGASVVTFVPPGHVFAPATLRAAAAVGLRYVCCRDARRRPPVDGVSFVDEAEVVAIHDRDVIQGGLEGFRRLLATNRATGYVTVGEVGARLAAGRR